MKDLLAAVVAAGKGLVDDGIVHRLTYSDDVMRRVQ